MNIEVLASATEAVVSSSETVVIISNFLVAIVSVALTIVTFLAAKAERDSNAHQEERLTNALSEALHREQIAAHQEEQEVANDHDDVAR